MPKQKSKSAELYKIIARGKKHFYESKATFENGWKHHSADRWSLSDCVGYRLTPKMVWVECRRTPAKNVFVKKPPQSYDAAGRPVTFIGRLENVDTLDAILSGALK